MNNSFIEQRCGAAPVPVSILDFSIAGVGHSASTALNTSIALARMADQRGFTRYWMAEHHAMPGVTTSSPPVLLARLISETKQIRLGSGGMMLPNFPPLVVAEQFGLLEAMAPGRIDLGVGRAPGTDVGTARALRRGHMNEGNYFDQLKELLHFLNDDFPEGHPYKEAIYAVPGPRQNVENGIPRSDSRPSVWVLGSSDHSAQLAGSLGLPFGFAAQLAPENVMVALEAYRKSFRPSAVLDTPYALISFGVSAAFEEQEAKAQAKSFAHSMMRMMQRKSYVLPPPEEVKAYRYDDHERFVIDDWNQKVLYGTGEQVIEKLSRYQEVTQANELMILPLGHSPEAILNTVRLIADAYGMPQLVNDSVRKTPYHFHEPDIKHHCCL